MRLLGLLCSKHKFISAAWIAAIFFFIPNAKGQERAKFPVERFRATGDGLGILDVESAQVLGHLTYDLAVWSGYLRNPLVLYRQQDSKQERAGALIRDRLSVNFVAALSLFERLQLLIDIRLQTYFLEAGFL